MNQNPKRLSTVTVILLGLTLFILGILSLNSSSVNASTGKSDAPAAASNTNEGVISSRGNGKELMAASQPWTKERMEAAQPYPLPVFDGEPEMSPELDRADGSPGLIPSKPPEGTNVTTIFEDNADRSSNTVPLSYTYPAPYTQYQNFDSYTVFPYSTIGVLFFSQYGFDYRCSAASIGNFAIWTAGHCIHTGDNSDFGWSTNVVFVPAYKNGNAPLGVWTADNLWTRTEWYSSEDLRFDIGGAILDTNSSGKSISQVVGNLGFAYNLSNDQHWFSFGYPSQSPFNGTTQEICSSSFAYTDTNMGIPNPVGVGCSMTPGSSGGPWIRQFSGMAGTSNFLNGNNSYRYTSHPEEMFSPYFGIKAKELWDDLMMDSPLLSTNLPIISR